jgi:hypothetical protein
LTTPGVGSNGGLASIPGLTGATGMTTPAFDNTASTAAGRKLGVRSMEGIDTLFQLFEPLRLL